MSITALIDDIRTDPGALDGPPEPQELPPYCLAAHPCDDCHWRAHCATTGETCRAFSAHCAACVSTTPTWDPADRVPRRRRRGR